MTITIGIGKLAYCETNNMVLKVENIKNKTLVPKTVDPLMVL